MMPALPPLQLSASSSATASAKGGDGAFGNTTGIQQGAWNVNLGAGSIATADKNPWLYVAMAAGAWWLARRRTA